MNTAAPATHGKRNPGLPKREVFADGQELRHSQLYVPGPFPQAVVKQPGGCECCDSLGFAITSFFKPSPEVSLLLLPELSLTLHRFPPVSKET